MSFIHKINNMFGLIPDWFVGLLLRVAAAVPFWRSGVNKTNGWDFWNVTDLTVVLFENEYDLPLIGPETAATLASIGEHVLPVLLVLGLLTRFGAAGLLVMTLTIQFLVYPNAWPVHILWGGLLIAIMARGPGGLSLDNLIGIEKKD